MIWNTLKRLSKLEAEKARLQNEVLSLEDDKLDLQRRLSDSMRAERNLSAWVSRLQSEREIDSMLREAEDA